MHTANAQPTPDLTDVVPSDPVLQRLQDEVSANNPSLSSMREQLAASRARESQAGAWMDPKLGIGAMNLPANSPLDLNQEPMTGLWINASQSIPLTGKYSSKRIVAEAMSDATHATVDQRTATVTDALRKAWYDWAYLRAGVASLDSTIQLVDDLLVVARTKYETGSGLQSSLLRLQTERSRLTSQRVELEQNARNAGRTVAVLLGRTPDAAPSAPAGLPVSFSTIDPAAMQQGAERSPAIQAAEQAVRANDARVNLARQLWTPELMLGVGYGYRQDADNGMDRADFITVTAGITLPVFGGSKQGRAVEEAVAEKRSAEYRLRETQLYVSRQIESLVDEDNRHAEQIQLYDQGILPQASSTLASTLSDYSVGRVGVEALVAAERELLNARLQRLMHLRDRAKVRSSLAALVYRTDVEQTTTQSEEK
ncbi:TolC family protein [bacterium]|nr:TolC family protein [bacterium]